MEQHEFGIGQKSGMLDSPICILRTLHRVANDGNTTVTEDNSGVYYDIQWVQVTAGGSPYEPEGNAPSQSSPTISINPNLISGEYLPR